MATEQHFGPTRSTGSSQRPRYAKFDRPKWYQSRVFRWIAAVLGVLVLALGIGFNRLVAWTFHTWPTLTMDQLTVVLGANIEGTNPAIIQEAVRWVIPLTVIALLAGLTAMFFIKRWRAWGGAIAAAIGLLVGFYAFNDGWQRLDAGTWIEYQAEESNFIPDNYVDPAAVHLQFPAQKRNLIFIFLESAEITFGDQSVGGGMPQTWYPGIQQLALNGETFSGNSTRLNGPIQLPGATHTSAGMFAQTSGLPLTFPFSSATPNDEGVLLPDVTNLGRILENEGYQQALLISTYGWFGDRNIYFSEVGNYDIWDLMWADQEDRITELVSGDRGFWGFGDKQLFSIAKDQLEYYSESDQPFNLTILTVDTHAPDGYVPEGCESPFTDKISSAWYCNSLEVAAFIDWVSQQPFYENTTIVISGDHLFPMLLNEFDGQMPADYFRTQLTAFINAAPVGHAHSYPHREYSAFDVFPTTLAALGVRIPGGRLALGVNLFDSEPTLIERYGPAYMTRQLNFGTPFLRAMRDGVGGFAERAEFEELLWHSDELISVEPLDQATNTFTVALSRGANYGSLWELLRPDWVLEPESVDLDTFKIAVWSEPQQGDLQWLYPISIDEDKVYFIVTVTDPRLCEYHIHAFRQDLPDAAFGGVTTSVDVPGCLAAADNDGYDYQFGTED